MKQKTLWSFRTLNSTGDGKLTEVCRSYDLRLLVQAIQNSYSKLGTLKFDYSMERDGVNTVWLRNDNGTRELGYIIPDRFMLLEKKDADL